MKTLIEIEVILKDSGLKSTPQRIAILDSLYKTRKHPTAEEIYTAIKTNLPSISLGTVYKTLEKFSETGLVKQIDTGTDKMRYDAYVERHFHLISETKDRIEDYFDKELNAILENYLSSVELEDFSIQNFNLQLIGTFKNKQELTQ